jgi:hypothetical protein
MADLERYALQIRMLQVVTLYRADHARLSGKSRHCPSQRRILASPLLDGI